VMEPLGLTVRFLREEAPGGVFLGELKAEGFPTPSGKVEIYSEALESMGYEPLPVHMEPSESPISRPDLASKYPLILTTGSRILEFLHSEHRNVKSLKRRMPEPYAEMSVETASRYGIRDEQMVTVETERGAIRIRAKVVEGMLPGVVNIPHGWDEANVNVLTDETPENTVGGQPALKSLLCRLSP